MGDLTHSSLALEVKTTGPQIIYFFSFSPSSSLYLKKPNFYPLITFYTIIDIEMITKGTISKECGQQGTEDMKDMGGLICEFPEGFSERSFRKVMREMLNCKRLKIKCLERKV